MTYIIPTLHPAHILRGAPLTDVIAADLRKVFRVAEFGCHQPENIVVAHPASPVGMEESVRCALQWIRRWRSMRCPVAVDVETSSVDFMACRLYSIALSGEDGCNTAVAFTLEDLITLPWDATAALVYELRQLLADATIPKIFHNAPFDMAVLIQHGYQIFGSILDTQGYAHCVQPDVRKTLGWVGHQWLDVEPWKRDHEGRKQALTSDIIELLVYNAKDALNTMKVRSLLEQEVLDRGMSYKLMQYQMAFSQLAARMEIHGIPINENIRRARSLEFQRKIQDYLQTMRQWLNWADFNPNRNAHVIEALYTRPRNGRNYLGLSPTQYTPSTRAPSVSYKAIIDHIQHPFVRAFMNYVETRDAWATRYRTADEGKPSKFTKNIYADGRLHPKWNPTGQKGSRFSSSPNCFDAQTEVLTNEGFIPFPEAIRREAELRFAQYDAKTEAITFTRATQTHIQENREVLHAVGQQVDICGTGDHRMLLREYNPNKHERQVHTVPLQNLPQHLRFVHAGKFKFGKQSYPEIFLRLLVACQADGSWCTDAITFDFNKERKYARLRWLLQEADISHTHKSNPEKKKHRYKIRIIKSIWSAAIKGLIGAERSWGSWLLNFTRSCVEIILDEVKYWDGMDKGRRFFYYGTKTNTSWIQILAILLGFRATQTDAKTCWRVNVSKSKAFSSARVIPERVHNSQSVYCITVPNDAIIIRRNGKSVIVHNCQNVPEKERDMFEAPPGRVMVQSDKDQLELRIIACRAGVRELVEEMAKPDADPHRLAAMNVYGEEFHQRSAKDQKNLRNMVKNVVYASLYNAGPQTVHRTIRVKKELDPAMRAAMTLKVVKHIHRSYFGKYVEIPAYHQRNYELAMTAGYNECEPLGRRRYFPVRPPPFTEVGNWVTQCEGSDHVGVEMVHIQEDLDALTKGDAQIIVHGHDAVCIECAERHAEQVQAIVDHHFGATRIEGPAGVVYLTSKADIGKNLRKAA